MTGTVIGKEIQRLVVYEIETRLADYDRVGDLDLGRRAFLQKRGHGQDQIEAVEVETIDVASVGTSLLVRQRVTVALETVEE